jgi:hypothetical protein
MSAVAVNSTMGDNQVQLLASAVCILQDELAWQFCLFDAHSGALGLAVLLPTCMQLELPSNSLFPGLTPCLKFALHTSR